MLEKIVFEYLVTDLKDLKELINNLPISMNDYAIDYDSSSATFKVIGYGYELLDSQCGEHLKSDGPYPVDLLIVTHKHDS